MTKGKVIIFSAPSGSGKTTIIQQLLAAGLPLNFSVSACNRAPRPGEVDGRDYYFLSTDAFRQKIETNSFLEWEEVYQGRFYGTLHSELERIWAIPAHPLFDLDVVGGAKLKQRFGQQALSLFIQPPSVDALRARLQQRGTDSPEEIDRRVAKAEYELGFASQFDRVVVNQHLPTAIEQCHQAIVDFLAYAPH